MNMTYMIQNQTAENSDSVFAKESEGISQQVFETQYNLEQLVNFRRFVFNSNIERTDAVNQLIMSINDVTDQEETKRIKLQKEQYPQ